MVSCTENQIDDFSTSLDQTNEVKDTENTTETYENSVSSDITTDVSIPKSEKIDIVEYVNPFSVSEYNYLNEKQQIAFVVLCEALNDIIKNGPTPYKQYKFPEPIPWFDYKVSHNLLDVNYTAIDNFASNLWCEKNSYVEENSGVEYVDGFYLYGYDVDYLEKEYSKYKELNSKADYILSSLEYDGTDYGKAYSIAKWMVNNITYPEDSEHRLSEMHNTAYTALMTHEAVCDGYAKAFDFLCKKAGLETIYITTSKISHAWNMIHLDGKWYHIDVTWMDSENNFYKYFMMSDSICYSTGHSKWEYYWDQKNNIKVSPIADSEDLYFYDNTQK